MTTIDYKSTCESLRADLRTAHRGLAAKRLTIHTLRKQVEFLNQSKSVTIAELENELQAIKAFNADGILVRS